MYKNTVEEANAYLDTIYDELINDGISYKSLYITVGGAHLSGGIWDIFTSRTNASVGYQIATSYYNTIKYRSMMDKWSEWQTFVLTSDFGYVDIVVETLANNQATIPDAPNTSNYIPVIVSHGASNTVLENVFWSGVEWRIYSNYAQKVFIRFYKYPV